MDRTVPPANPGYSRLDRRHGPERGGRHAKLCPGQPPERVIAVTRVVKNLGRHRGVGRLEQKGADRPHEHGGVANDGPGRRAGAEEPRIPSVSERLR